MKKLLTALFAISTLFATAQTPQGINYQSIIRNTAGVVLPSTPVTVEFKLYAGSLPGAILLYDETHSATTNSFGMVNLVIGQGSVVGGVVAFNSIPWIVGVNYEVYVNSSLVGSRQAFMSVPYALHSQPPAVTFSNNTLSVGGNTVSITTGQTYTAGTGIAISGNTITNNAPDQTVSLTGLGSATVTGSYPNFTVETPTVSAATPPTIVGAGSATVTSAGNTFTVNAPVYTAGNGIDISGGVISNTAVALTPTITGIGSATVTSSGNTFTVNTPAPQIYTAGSDIFISSGAINNAAPDKTVTITAAGSATVTGSYPNFTLNVPNGTVLPNGYSGQLLFNNGTSWDTIPRMNLYFDGTNFGIGTLSPQMNFHVVGSGRFDASVTTPQIFTDNIKITGGTAGQILTSDASGNGTWQSPAAVSSTSLTAGNPNITLSQSGNSYTVSSVTPTLTVNGGSLSGSYPTQTLTIPTSSTTVLTASTNIAVTGTAPNYTISSLSQSLTVNSNSLSITGSNTVVIPTSSVVAGNPNITVTPSGNTYSVSAVTPTLTVNGGALTGSYPTQTLTIPTSSTTAITASTNVVVSGTAPNYTISSPSQSLTVNSNSLSITGANTIVIPTSSVVPGNANITVIPSGNTYAVSAVTPTLTVNGGALAGIYPTQTLTIPTSSVVSGNANITVTPSGNTYSVSAVTPTLTVNGGALAGTYPTQTLTIPTNSTTILTPSTNVVVSGTAPNYTLSSPSQSLTINSNSLSITGANTVVIPTSTVVAGSNITVAPSGNLYTVSAAPYSLTSNSNTLTLSNGSAITTATVPVFSLTGGAANSITKWTSATTLGNSIITDNGTNIGINNSSPSAKLDVLGTFKLADGSQGAGKVLTSDGVGNASWNLPPGGPWSRNSTTVTLTNPGDWVGIGTNSPNSPFQVANYISFESNGSNTSLGSGTGGGVSPNNYYNTYVGAMAGQAAGTGTASSNSFLGYQAGQNNTNGDNNTIMGANAGTSNTAGSDNSFFGTGSGRQNTTGVSNVFIGHDAGLNNATASSNTFIGDRADLSSSTQYTNATAIGFATKVSDNDMIALGNKSNVIIGGAQAGIISGATRYLTVANTTTYSSTTNTSLELQGLTNSASSSAARIDFINGLSPTAIARVEAITGTGSTVQGALRFMTNGGTLGEIMRITETGRVGIGTTAPGGLFELGLDQGRKPGSGTWTIASDERLKTIEGNYTKGLKEILQLQPISYHYKNVGERKFDNEVTKTLYAGFSAQDVQKIFPEAVGVDADGYLNLNIHAILIAYTNAVKELNAKAENQQKTIEEQKKAIEELQLKYDERLKRLEAALENKTK